MADTGNSSSLVQMQAERVIFQRVQEQLHIELKRNPRIPLNEDGRVFMQPDFYSEEQGVVGEIFAHVGKPKKAQDNKIANDILKMLLLQEKKGRTYKKIIVVCDREEMKKLKGKSVLAESIRQFDIDVICIDIDEAMRKQILSSQEQQKMTNAF